MGVDEVEVDLVEADLVADSEEVMQVVDLEAD